MTLCIVADENVPALVVASLRAAGHDVSYGCEHGQGASDADRVKAAYREGRVILTEDNDFAESIIAHGHASHGLIRFDLFGFGRERKPARILEAIREIGDDVAGRVFVIEHARVRSRRIEEG